MKTVPLCLGIRRRRRRKRSERSRQLEQQSRQLAPSCAQALFEHVAIADADEELERLDERLVGSADDGVGRTVENQRPALGGVVHQLSGEPRLAASGLAADEGDLSTCARFGEREEAAQRLEFLCAADEWKRWRCCERARNNDLSGHEARSH